jgi:hypothetical protein
MLWPGLHIEQRGIEPDILTVRCDQESPAGRQGEVLHDLGIPLVQMRHVLGPEEIIGLQQFTRPDIPAAGLTFRRMSEPVDGTGRAGQSSRNADDLTSRHGVEFGPEPEAQLSLNCRQLMRRQGPGVPFGLPPAAGGLSPSLHRSGALVVVLPHVQSVSRRPYNREAAADIIMLSTVIIKH